MELSEYKEKKYANHSLYFPYTHIKNENADNLISGNKLMSRLTERIMNAKTSI